MKTSKLKVEYGKLYSMVKGEITHNTTIKFEHYGQREDNSINAHILQCIKRKGVYKGKFAKQCGINLLRLDCLSNISGQIILILNMFIKKNWMW